MVQDTPQGDGLGPATLSLSDRLWHVPSIDEGDIASIKRASGCSDLLARLLAQRGVTAQDAAGFLSPKLRDSFPDPFSFCDMKLGANLVLDAILAEKNVTVFADYDVDGGTSSALLSKYFRHFDRPLDLYVPDRIKEGYGPSPEAFQALKDAGADLVITVDCGAAAVSALETARDIDLPVIVIDHHLMGQDLPPSAALINPNRADDQSGQGHLAAAGVVYVFLAALNACARERGILPASGVLPDLLAWLDLAALGTVCDMCPLTGVNRAFVAQGLKILGQGQNVGLRALADVSGVGVADSVYHAGFVLGPRLNAGGRIGDPWLAAKLLASEDREEALAVAERLHVLNEARKAVEEEIRDAATVEAQRLVKANPDLPCLVIAGEGWHPGVIGIVAGRLKDKFNRPVVIIGFAPEYGTYAKGSARSVKGVNIGNAISAAAKAGILASGGGHAMAGGLSVLPNEIAAFTTWLINNIGQFTTGRLEAPSYDVSGYLSLNAVTPDLINDIARAGPFGVGSPQPLFGFKDVKLTAKRVGANHLRCSVADSSGSSTAMAWRIADEPIGEALQNGGQFHILGRLKADAWNGRTRAQIELVDAVVAAF